MQQIIYIGNKPSDIQACKRRWKGLLATDGNMHIRLSKVRGCGLYGEVAGGAASPTFRLMVMLIERGMLWLAFVLKTKLACVRTMVV